MENKSIVITGVSTGIGYATAEIFLKNGYQVFGSVRKPGDAEYFQNTYPNLFTPLVFDVTDESAIVHARSIVKEKLQGEGLSGLINNAGIAEGGPLELLPNETIKKHFDVNVMGLIMVTKIFLPLLGTDPNHTSAPGKILNISSSSGKIASPFVGPYVGSKHAVEGISHSWRRELMKYGIDVIIIGPGAVKTPIWDKGINPEQFNGTAYEFEVTAFSRYVQKRIPGGLTPEYLAQRIWKIFHTGNPKTRYALVPVKLMRWTLPRLLPDRWIDRLIAGNFRNPEKPS